MIGIRNLYDIILWGSNHKKKKKKEVNQNSNCLYLIFNKDYRLAVKKLIINVYLTSFFKKKKKKIILIKIPDQMS